MGMFTQSVDEYGVTASLRQEYDMDLRVKDADLLLEVMHDHARRHAQEQQLSTIEDGFVHKEDDRLHVYELDDGLTSGLSVFREITGDVDAFDEEDFHAGEAARHRAMAEDRMTALVGRANKAAELADHIERFEEYGLAETVLDAYREGPVLGGEWLREDVIKEHGMEALEEVPEYLFQRPGMVDVDDAAYDTVRAQVAGDAFYDETGAGALDLEVLSKGRSMDDFYRADDDYEEVYDAVIGLVEDRLEEQGVV